ncbi:YveK family protein [Cohnella hongkongensis]|uniref:YveK family protein n=1 Tax=Cohnella hongkongensis TaxID=178337 RepID=A0ABV9FBM1_9BACL
MELTIKDYFKILLKRWWLMAIVVTSSCLAVAAYDYYYPNPIYEAETKLIVTSTSQSTAAFRPDMNEINTNIMLIETYKEIIATPAIMEAVALQYPDIRMDAGELISKVRVESSSGSQVMSISIRDPSLDQAVMIVNAIAQVFRQEIPKIMNVDNITILREAKPGDHSVPVSYGIVMKTLIAFALSLFFSAALVFLLDYLDDTVKSEEEIESLLGLPALASVSRIKFTRFKRSKETLKKKPVGESVHVGIPR